ncbi:MAG: long-chain-acyl-CoA synthetase, partial [Crocinitomicaceae bacterium]|nr:long-chain-acyl-CoA synthetase [Crocinitomicaceae bacterium]
MAVFRKLGSYSRFVGKLNGILKLMKGLDSESTILIPDEIENTVDRFPDKTAFIFEGRHLSFAAFEQLANRVANWGLEQDLKQGDAIALVMENCP